MRKWILIVSTVLAKERKTPKQKSIDVQVYYIGIGQGLVASRSLQAKSTVVFLYLKSIQLLNHFSGIYCDMLKYIYEERP